MLSTIIVEGARPAWFWYFEAFLMTVVIVGFGVLVFHLFKALKDDGKF